ncbi:putative serine protease K12H4.7 [Drosophila tropicalis]|uniref:putative serine protease K12H4.7 n=1 Tax=Drosophila tropicalis TaxID=46794 RepID=UPI0035AB973B
MSDEFHDKFQEKFDWIEQKVDNFNASDNRTWKMRYSYTNRYFKPGGPIMINVGGEWSISMKAPLLGLFYEMIEEFHGYGFSTEHRYYGKSFPVADLSMKNLKYLSTEQALADLDYFIKYQKSKIKGLSNSKVIMVGCSYAGGMVTWFRKYYPQSIDAGWASGAALHHALDYSDGLISVGKSIRKICGDSGYNLVERMSLSYWHHKRQNDSTYLELEAKNLTIHLEHITEIFSTEVQHRNFTYMKGICRNMTTTRNNDIFKFSEFLGYLATKIPHLYSFDNADSLKVDENTFGRQWLWQSCNGMGAFMTTSSVHQPFGQYKMPFTEVIGKCKKQFGDKYTIDYVSSMVDSTNIRHGGYEPNVTHIYFTHAEDDPWKYTGIHDERATIIPGIGHCHDLRQRNVKDWPLTRAAKEHGVELMRQWINKSKNIVITHSIDNVNSLL